MDETPARNDTKARGERLDSWKEIAAYLKRDVRTAQRWEKQEALPRRDRTTNAAIGPPSRALYTYQQDGTVLESQGALLFQPGQRSSGHGTWTHSGGGTFSERVVGILLFDSPPNTPPGSPGFLTGWQLIAATITMTGADQFTATALSQFFDLNRQVYRSGCSTRVGERFR